MIPILKRTGTLVLAGLVWGDALAGCEPAPSLATMKIFTPKLIAAPPPK